MGCKGGPFDKILFGHVIFNHEELSKRVVRDVEHGKAPGYTNLGDTHLVGGQSSSFVGADYIRTTKGFDTREVPNDCVLLSHLFGSEGKACGDYGGEALWDSSDSKCYGDFEVMDSAVDHTSVGWIPEVPEVDDPDEDTNDTDDFGKHISKVIQLAFKRCLLIDLRCNGLVDITNGCLLAGKDYDGLGVTIHNGRSLGERK